MKREGEEDDGTPLSPHTDRRLSGAPTNSSPFFAARADLDTTPASQPIIQHRARALGMIMTTRRGEGSARGRPRRDATGSSSAERLPSIVEGIVVGTAVGSGTRAAAPGTPPPSGAPRRATHERNGQLGDIALEVMKHLDRLAVHDERPLELQCYERRGTVSLSVACVDGVRLSYVLRYRKVLGKSDAFEVCFDSAAPAIELLASVAYECGDW